MGHNLNYNEQSGQHSFFSVKEKAWHGLGQIVEEYPTSAEAIRYAGLDYLVEKRPLFTNTLSNAFSGLAEDISSHKMAVPNFYATVRYDNDAVLGVVGKDYAKQRAQVAFNLCTDFAKNGADALNYLS